MWWKKVFILMILLFLWSGIAYAAQESSSISIWGGVSTNGKESLYTGPSNVMQIEYRFKAWGENLSLSYVNGGRFNGEENDPNGKHHWDAFFAQYWLQKRIGNFNFATGAGLGYVCDTTNDWSNLHKLGGIGSGEVAYFITPNWTVGIKANAILGRDINGVMGLVGTQYYFKPDSLVKIRGEGQEIGLFVGGSWSNSNQTNSSIAWGAEYRWHAKKLFDSGLLDFTAAYLNEGDTSGLISQFWVIKKYGPLSFGPGIGIYFNDKVDMVISPLTVSYDITERFGIRLEGSRIVDFSNKAPGRDKDFGALFGYLSF
jgi:hypothetical protein